MKRKVIDELIIWKTTNTGTPILLTGAKGVGKTYLAYDFAKAFFEDIYYINFEREPGVAKQFISTNIQMTIDYLKEYFHIASETPVTSHIIILDEISCCEEALKLVQSLQFSELFPFIITISSNPLSKEYQNQYPRLQINPLEFDEFLRATNNEWYIETIINHFNANKKVPEIVHKELLTLHKLFLQIGGMPGMVNEYLNLFSVVNVLEQQSFLIGSYHDYILKDNSDSEALKMNQVFDSLVHQLMKDNKKFQYRLIRKGTTHAMYKDAIRKLTDANYIIRCNRINKEQFESLDSVISIEDSENDDVNTNFKLYLPDTGLLYSRIIEEQGTPFSPYYKKALLENYVAQSLQAKNYPFAFWESDSMAKIDFIIQKDNQLIPIEIHENDNTRSKSISVFKQKYNVPYAIKISSKNFDFSNQIKYVPYYAVFCI